jgi:hypothetical protein
MPDGTDSIDATLGEVFISRTGADKDIAVAQILREAGYATFLQDEDFGHTSFMARMTEGFDKVENGGRIVAILSKQYVKSDYCLKEAQYPLIGDSFNRRQRLIVLRIDDCQPTGHLKDIPYIDLSGVLSDPVRLGEVVRGAIRPDASDANVAANYLRGPKQIIHRDIEAVPNFTGRLELLGDLDLALGLKGGATALIDSRRVSASLHGLGGVGKSVLAREYAWRVRGRYTGVWWIRAETRQTIGDNLIALGSKLDVANSLNNPPRCSTPRPVTTRPSRSTAAPSPSARPRSGPTTPMSPPASTISPCCAVPWPATPRPSRSSAAPLLSTKRHMGRTTLRSPQTSTT